MTPAASRLTRSAKDDIRAILRGTAKLFGRRQRDAYAGLIAQAVALVCSEPERPGTRNRDDIAPGVRSLHVGLAAQRRGAAVHIVFYIHTNAGVTVLRVLHESMDYGRHLANTVQ